MDLNWLKYLWDVIIVTIKFAIIIFFFHQTS
jgi:hypothetical protein